MIGRFKQYTIDGQSYTALGDICEALNLTRAQIRWRRKKDPNWLVAVKLVKDTPPKKEYYIGDGVKYLTLEQAGIAHGITKEAVRQRCKGSKWNWFKVVDGVQQPKKAQRILDKTSYYYKKKMGIPTPRIVPKKYKPRVKKTPMPRNLSEYLDAMFAKKDAKKPRK